MWFLKFSAAIALGIIVGQIYLTFDNDRLEYKNESDCVHSYVNSGIARSEITTLNGTCSLKDVK